MHPVSWAITLLLFSAASHAAPPRPFDVCGRTDDRVFSEYGPVGRLRENLDAQVACSGALIGASCMLTAGHCSDLLEVAEFAVPHSASNGALRPAAAKNRYRVAQIIDLEEVWYTERDWAVIRLAPNAVTGKAAGDELGFLPVSSSIPKRGDALELIGFGSDRGGRNYAQKRGQGKLVSVGRGLLELDLDTSGGDSGGPVLNARGEIVGVLTLGGCEGRDGTNGATALHLNARLRRAIARCLALR